MRKYKDLDSNLIWFNSLHVERVVAKSNQTMISSFEVILLSILIANDIVAFTPIVDRNFLKPSLSWKTDVFSSSINTNHSTKRISHKVEFLQNHVDAKVSNGLGLSSTAKEQDLPGDEAAYFNFEEQVRVEFIFYIDSE